MLRPFLNQTSKCEDIKYIKSFKRGSFFEKFLNLKREKVNETLGVTAVGVLKFAMAQKTTAKSDSLGKCQLREVPVGG